MHIISPVAYNVKWNPIQKKVYSKIEKKNVDMIFHSLNVIHMYNFGMGSVDFVDQICMQYRPDNWMCNSKWWWLIFLGGLGGSAKTHT